MNMKLLTKFRFWSTAILANIISLFSYFDSETFPILTTPITHSTFPIGMLLTSVCFGAKFVVTGFTTEVMLPFVGSSFSKSNQFPTGTTRYYWYILVIRRMTFPLYGFQMNSITSRRAPSPNNSLFTVCGKFFPTYFTNQFSHEGIIAEIWRNNKAAKEAFGEFAKLNEVTA